MYEIYIGSLKLPLLPESLKERCCNFSLENTCIPGIYKLSTLITGIKRGYQA